MSHEQPGTETRMRRALDDYLPDQEPPIGLRVDRVIRLGRRRHRVRRAAPIVAAAVVTALAVAVPWLIGTGEPNPDRLPSGVAASTGHAPEPAFRPPPGHVRGKDADALAKTVADRQPAENVAAYFGTNSKQKAHGGRYGFGFHILWQDAGRYGYLAMLHRSKGDFPASVYGMPDEPCLTAATRSPEYHCAPVAVPDGDVAYSFEIGGSYRVRGVVWDHKDPAGGADIRITGAFALPGPGAWTPFAALEDRPRLTSFPLTTTGLADLIGIPR